MPHVNRHKYLVVLDAPPDAVSVRHSRLKQHTEIVFDVAVKAVVVGTGILAPRDHSPV